MANWRFFIDVGGTFTDTVALRPDGTLVTGKLLSSGVVRGAIERGSTPTCIHDTRRVGEPSNFWVGYSLTVTGGGDAPVASSRVQAFDPESGTLHLESPLWDESAAQDHVRGKTQLTQLGYELNGGEEAPVLAIRLLMELRLDEPIGPIEVRLGTTRATNALLERKGASVAFVTTKGFADVLKIGNQDRPALFDLNIRKRDELTTAVLEIDERMSAAGEILRAPDSARVREQLSELHQTGIETLAICLLHAHVNPQHEEVVAAVAADVGFEHVSVSSTICRIEKIVPRGDTTVVDAYLAPVVRDYVETLRRSMPEARLQLMTSAGGLVWADDVLGKDTILSGPAGGVVGCAHVARQAGIDKTIGFDMGGTSTDVSRIDPLPQQFEYTNETEKAGVRLMTPMLAVETVAAGGGSVCAFDGRKLTVGPHSAGADPGPACYGQGGPLTVTDMNLLLGRIVPAYFPLRLDLEAVTRMLVELRGQSEEGDALRSLEPIALAEGFVAIANAKMAAAIKRISLARGIDVRDYVLTTFGGAGAQHACTIARSLGINRILCSPFAGVLSAVGIGAADIKRIEQQSVHEALEPGAEVNFEPLFTGIVDRLRQELLVGGIEEERILPPTRTIDLCYEGQSTLITVSAERFDEARERFETLHRQLYGYCHEGRPIEVRLVRVELVARSDHVDSRVVSAGERRDVQERFANLVVDGAMRPVPLHLRSELAAGQHLQGPAIVIEDTSTIVLESGWEAEVLDTGDLLLTDVEEAPQCEQASGAVDPVRLELFNNQFAAIAEQMGTTLRRTALSVNVKERLDFSCAIFTPEGDLVVNAPHIPVHLGGMSDCVKALMEDVDAFGLGDVYITNDPYRGGSHLNDITVITPVHDDQGRDLLFFVASRAHHAEIGGTRPGSMPPDSTSLAEEGVVIRAFSWVKEGRSQHEALRELLTTAPYPSRTPDSNLADIAAQVAANQTGVLELKAMMARFGVDVVHSYMRHIQEAAAWKMRQALKALPDGLYAFEDQLDDGSPINLSVSIMGDHATLDFAGTGAVLPGNLNANRSIVASAVMYCLRCLIAEDIPLNAGVLEAVAIRLPTCLLNPPSAADPAQCPALVGGNVETSQRIVDCVFGALKTVAASQGTMNNLLMGSDQGSGGWPAFGYYETICGGAGAGQGFHGADAVQTHMTNTRLTDPEVLEACVPVRLIRFAIRHGSGGEGQYRGGCGVTRELEFLAPLDVSILSQRRTTAPYGLRGGKPGARGRNLLRRAGSDQVEVLPSVAHCEVQSGDRLIIETPGGGGWGAPREG